MSATTHAEFNGKTEGLEVAKAFSFQIRGKTALITGVNKGGLGYATAQALASQSPVCLIIAGRNPSKVEDCITALKSEYPSVNYRALNVDLSSQQSVRSAASEALSWTGVPSIDLIFNSAGVMGVQERTLTEDGLEMHFATNHIGHWLLTTLLMPKLIKASEVNLKGATRVVNVASRSPTVATMRFSDVSFEKLNKDLPQDEQPYYEVHKTWGYANSEEVAYVPIDGYNRSKVANVLFGIGANKRLFDKYGILTTSVHPGIIKTELGRNFPDKISQAVKNMAGKGVFTYKTLGAGVSTALVAALDPKLANGVGDTKDGSENWGAFMMDCQISDQATAPAVSSKKADELWELSERLVGEKFSW